MENQSLEQQVLNLRAAGYSFRAIAALLDINKSKVEHILKSTFQTEPANLFETGQDTSLRMSQPGPDSYQTLSDSLSQTAKDNPQFMSETVKDTFQTLSQALEQPQLRLKTDQNNRFAPENGSAKDNPRHLFSHIHLFQEDLNEFIADMSEIYLDGLEWEKRSFVRFLKKTDRLNKIANLLSIQLEAQYKSLLIHQVLASIKSTLLQTLQNQDSDLDENDLVESEYAPELVALWHTVLGADFFQSVND